MHRRSHARARASVHPTQPPTTVNMEQEYRGRRHGENGPRAPVSSESKGRTGLRQKMRRLFGNTSEQAEPDSASVTSPARTDSVIRQTQHRNSSADRDLREEELPPTQSAAIQLASARRPPFHRPLIRRLLFRCLWSHRLLFPRPLFRHLVLSLFGIRHILHLVKKTRHSSRTTKSYSIERSRC